jgi:uncharacterized protein (DUF433 family)
VEHLRLAAVEGCRYVAGMSTLSQTLFTELASAPEPVQREVLDFVVFLKARTGGLTPVKTFIRHTPGVCGGEACIRMTRIAVWMLEEARRAQASDADLLADYPDLTREDLEAAWQYISTHAEEIETAIRANHAV